MAILEAYKESARGAVCANETPEQLTARAYRYHRRAGKPATAALRFESGGRMESRCQGIWGISNAVDRKPGGMRVTLCLIRGRMRAAYRP